MTIYGEDLENLANSSGGNLERDALKARSLERIAEAMENINAEIQEHSLATANAEKVVELPVTEEDKARMREVVQREIASYQMKENGACGWAAVVAEKDL
jgi:broad-specificity NMP kinase